MWAGMSKWYPQKEQHGLCLRTTAKDRRGGPDGFCEGWGRGGPQSPCLCFLLYHAPCSLQMHWHQVRSPGYALNGSPSETCFLYAQSLLVACGPEGTSSSCGLLPPELGAAVQTWGAVPQGGGGLQLSLCMP